MRANGRRTEPGLQALWRFFGAMRNAAAVVEGKRVALAAIIIADDDDDSAAVAVLGRPAIEVTLGRAVALGARHVVVLTQRVPPSLLGAADRFRATGIGVDLARGIADAVERVHPDEALLIMPQHVFVPDTALRALLAAPSPALLVVARDDAPAPCELVDARHAATGHALTDGTELRAVVAAMGEWELGATLRRALVQRGATRVEIDAGEVAVVDPGRARVIGRTLLRNAEHPGNGIGEHWLVRPFARLLASVIGESGLSDRHLAGAAIITSLAGAIAALAGLAITGLVLVLLASLLIGVAGPIGRSIGFGLHPRAGAIVNGMSATGQCAVTLRLAESSGQWGYLAMGVAVLVAVALGQTARLALPSRQRRWLADAPWCALLLGIGVAAGMPLVALVLLAAHATAGLARGVRSAIGEGLAGR